MKRKAIIFFLFAVVLVSFFMATVCHAEDIRLIVRGDDLRMTQGSIAAFEKSFKEGVLTCASLLVVAPWFEAATDLIRRNPAGVSAFTSAWSASGRAIAGGRSCPGAGSLRLSMPMYGFLFLAPGQLWSNKPKPEEIEAEFRAQIDPAREKGVKLQYIDLHYAAADDVEKSTRKLSKEYGLPISGTLGEKYAISVYKTPSIKSWRPPSS